MLLIYLKLYACCCDCAVQSSTQVKITDFGLAKLLDHNEQSFKSTGVKVLSLLLFGAL